MAFFSDSFVEPTTDTELSAHAPDLGDSWTKLFADDTVTFGVFAASDTLKTLVSGSNSGVVYVANATYPSADYEVSVKFVNSSNIASRPIFLFARMVDIENCYAMRFVNAANACQLYKKVGGTWTALGSAVTIALGSVIKLSVEGTAIKVYDDGAEVIGVTDGDITAAGKAGVGMGGGAELIVSGNDPNSANELDDFSVSEIEGGGGGVTVIPGAATAGAATVNPVVPSGVTVTPAPAIAVVSTVDPLVLYGGITITPAPAAAGAVTISPIVIGDGITITPTAAVARAVTVNPSVIIPGEVPPLGQGDTNGFIVFMIARSFHENLTAAGLEPGVDVPDEANAAEWGTWLFG